MAEKKSNSKKTNNKTAKGKALTRGSKSPAASVKKSSTVKSVSSSKKSSSPKQTSSAKKSSGKSFSAAGKGGAKQAFASKKSAVSKSAAAASKSSAAKQNRQNVSSKTSAAVLNKEAGRTKKKITAGKIVAGFCIAAAVIVLASVLIFYVRKDLFYQEHFYEGTYINGVDCSEYTTEEACATVQDQLNTYSFTVNDEEGRSYTVTAPEISMTYDNNGEIEELLNGQNAWKWPFESKDAGNYLVAAGYTFDENALTEWTRTLDCVNDGTPSVDASYKEIDNGYYEIVPEVYGDEIDFSVLNDAVINSVRNGDASLDVASLDCYIKPQVYSDDAELVKLVKDNNDKRDAEIARAALIEEMSSVEISFFTFKDEEALVLGKELILSFIDDSGKEPVFDEEAVTEWTENWAAERGLTNYYDLFTTNAGKLIYVPNGYQDGWRLDVEKTAEKLYDALVDGQDGIIHPALVSADGKYLDETTYVEICITDQTMWCYVDGQEKIETPVVTGNVSNGYATPSNGVWAITAKMRDHTMYGARNEDGEYSYISFCQYWMPFNDTIGIHDLASRTAYGGDIYLTSGSHGCVNTPLEAVKQIYSWVSVGTRVVVHTPDQSYYW